jgi:lipopolysaccharide export system permease protein
MRRLNRYLITETVKLLLVSELVGLAIFVLVDFFEHIDVLTKTLDDFLLGLVYLALQVPAYFSLILPLAFLVAMLILIIMMIRGNEIIIARTAGVSTFSLMRPLVSMSLVLVVLSFSLSEWVVPMTSSWSEYIFRVKIKKEQTYVEFKNDRIWLKRGRTICCIDLFDAERDTVKGLSVFEVSDAFTIEKRYDAKSGRWNGSKWEFTDVTERTFRNNGIESRTFFPKMEGLITEPPSVFKIVDKTPEEMSYRELQHYINRLKRNGHDVKKFVVDLDAKVSFPFINVIMVLAAFSVGLRYSKAKNISKGIFSGILIGMLYWFSHYIALSFGRSEVFPPWFAAWFANTLFLASGIIGIITART